jgi:membrane protease YdiL (CAAX protease family)
VVTTTGAIGAVLASVYLWRGSLVVASTVHFLIDLGGVVLVPHLGLPHRAVSRSAP